MRYIFFDVDGVLINGFHANEKHRRRWDENLQQDLGIDPDLLQAAFFHREFPDVLLGKKDLHKALKDILPEIGFAGMPQTLIDYWFKHDALVNPETLDVVQQLKQTGARLFLATHQEKNRATYLWHELGFKNHFEEIFFSGRMGLRKTNPDFFNKIENELCLEEAECLLIDDDPAVCAAAGAAGWKTILFNTTDDIQHLVK